jgi:hypothetical protein
MTAYEIGVLLHYYAHADDHPDVERRPPIWERTLAQFINNDVGLLTSVVGERNTRYAITPRGRAYVDSLQLVPLPESRWVTTWPPVTTPPIDLVFTR